MKKTKMAKKTNVEIFHVEVFEASTISVALFQDFKGFEELKQRLFEGDIDAALLSPKLICDVFQLFCASTKAMHSQQEGNLKTRNVNSEIIYSLSPSGNISDSFKKFGVSSEDRAVLAVVVNDNDGSKMAAVIDCIDGQIVELNQLKQFTEEERVKKVYKVSDVELRNSSLLDAVVTRMATKECT